MLKDMNYAYAIYNYICMLYSNKIANQSILSKGIVSDIREYSKVLKEISKSSKMADPQSLQQIENCTSEATNKFYQTEKTCPIEVAVESENVRIFLEKASKVHAPNGKPSEKLIRELARAIGLIKETDTNPHLSFLDGDIAYWSEQQLNWERLKLEFAARKAVLDAADKKHIFINDQGTLSCASQPIMAEVLKEDINPH
jgi:hypothetical protein